jgi:hypothetical protein
MRRFGSETVWRARYATGSASGFACKALGWTTEDQRVTATKVHRTIAGLYLTLAVVLSAAGEAAASDDLKPDGMIDVRLAATVARHHLLRSETAGTFTLGGARAICDPATGAVLCYCFDLQPRGYVVVSSATSLPPVVAYSFTSEAGGDTEPGNPLMDLLRWDLGLRLEQADRRPAAVAAEQHAAWGVYLADAPLAPGGRAFQQWPPAGSTPTGGWLLTNWTQNAPYYNLCPWDSVNNQRSLAGCPAIAMAQILNYRARLNGTHFSDADDYYHSYGGNYYWIDNGYASWGFPSFPQLNAHLDALFDNYFHGVSPSDTRKAALVFACGVAAQQVYSASGSGTFGVSQAMDAYQRFGCGTAALLDANTPDLQVRLSKNMKSGYPAHLAVVNASWTVGHNLVMDGYNTNGYYHLNYGWGGSYNGWYLLLSGLPYGLTVIEGVIADIMVDECTPMDCNCDGVVAWSDFGYFRQVLAGPSVTYSAPGGRAFDSNGDGDVDMDDFRVFQTAFSQVGS